MIEDQALLTALKQAPVFGYDIHEGTRAAVGLCCDLHTSVEEAASGDRGVLSAYVDVASIARMQSNPCIVSYYERERPTSIAEPKRVGRARCQLVSSSHDQPVVSAITMHGERDCTRFDVRVRDLIDVEARRNGRREPVKRSVNRTHRRGVSGDARLPANPDGFPGECKAGETGKTRARCAEDGFRPRRRMEFVVHAIQKTKD
jgi:hypothetical protein